MEPKVLNGPRHRIAEVLMEYGPLNCYVVMRGSHWGNPFILDEEKDRDMVCDLFEKYAVWRLTVQPNWLAPLRGKHLICCCAPKRCHADTLLRLANQ